MKTDNIAKARIALAHLRAARDIFKAIDNKRTVERIRAAISSGEGAVRIQEYRSVRHLRYEGEK
jgi:hypothetical protein